MLAASEESDPPPESSPVSAPADLGGGERSLLRNTSLSRLNAQAKEFVPRLASGSGCGAPIQYHHPVPVVQYRHGNLHRPGGTQYYGPQRHPEFAAASAQFQQFAVESADYVPPPMKDGLTEEAAQKLISQVEYYFSDINLATTDHLMRYINKDAEGYVPVSVVASFKKIKAVISSNSQLASILRNSAKLVVSEDGKKVKRQHPLTQLNLEELQSRIVVAENLPLDHCHQNLMKIFSAVGSVKTIRTCQPQSLNGGASSASRPGKADSMPFSNKLHAFVEYESVELAEKAVAELNDEANWRNGLKVRLFVRNMGKSAQPRGKKSDHKNEGNDEEDSTSSTVLQHQMSEKQVEDPPPPQQVDSQSREHIGQGEEHMNERESGLKKAHGRGKGKGRCGRAPSQYHHHYNSNNHQQQRVETPSSASEHQQQSISSKQPPGPRMPDGTRGFSMGRGKPLLTVNNSSIA